jgi:hypothetical protein
MAASLFSASSVFQRVGKTTIETKLRFRHSAWESVACGAICGKMGAE